jgi:RHH-type proline utilization regulon transcriptional repressor/proline dehydrogenase/delta 1-pyrroline-5-carboxylate dehydrogenase
VHHAIVGNIYINRNMIGAKVGSQPFGGHGLSGTGPKTGGPNYVHAFVKEYTITTNTSAFGGNQELLS